MYVACYRVANTDMQALHAICNHDDNDDADNHGEEGDNDDKDANNKHCIPISGVGWH